VDLGEGIEGLLPSNQIAGRNDVMENSAVRVRVLNVEPERQRVGLALQAVVTPAAEEDMGEEPLESEDEGGEADAMDMAPVDQAAPGEPVAAATEEEEPVTAAASAEAVLDMSDEAGASEAEPSPQEGEAE
jgi:hypothetical protein